MEIVKQSGGSRGWGGRDELLEHRRFFWAVKIHCMMLQWWIHVIMHFI